MTYLSCGDLGKDAAAAVDVDAVVAAEVVVLPKLAGFAAGDGVGRALATWAHL